MSKKCTQDLPTKTYIYIIYVDSSKIFLHSQLFGKKKDTLRRPISIFAFISIIDILRFRWCIFYLLPESRNDALIGTGIVEHLLEDYCNAKWKI